MSEEKVLVQRFCFEFWWIVLLRGIALTVLGGLLIAKPGISVIVWVQILGAYFLLDGVFSVFHSIKGRKYMQGWGWGIFMGALEILTGIIVFTNPLVSAIVTASVLVYSVAFMAILFGVLGIVTGIQVRKEIKGEWSMIAGGVLAIIFSVILIMNPMASMSVYLIVMGVMALMGGLIQIFASFQIRKFGKHGIEAFAE
jgi:uncharacterized membrane protein HdeD (DUF308 family)